MRYFLTRRIPHADAILLIESGSRSLLETVFPGLRQTWGDDVAIDLVTCYARPPQAPRPLPPPPPRGLPCAPPRLPHHRLPRPRRPPQTLPRARRQSLRP